MQNTEHSISPQMFHEFLRDKIDHSSVQQSDIAQELGFARANIISMFKSGKTRIPMEKIPRMAKILGIDPKMMLRMAMLEYAPELLRAIEQTFGASVTKNEQVILDEIRMLSQGTDPGITSIAHREAAKQFVSKLMERKL